MITDFRALCAELSGLLDNLHSLICVECPRALDEDSGGDFALDLRIEEALERARAALAQADVPQGRELAAVTGQPSDEDLRDLHEWMTDEWAADHDFKMPPSVYARAVLARWGNPAPASPADGEVAKLVEWLQETGRLLSRRPDIQCRVELSLFTRAAELLQRQATAYAICERERLHQSTRAADLEVEGQAVPVAVSERLPGPEDCDDQGRCWWLVSHQSWPCLYLMKAYIGLDAAGATHWLPAHALPLPEVNNDHA